MPELSRRRARASALAGAAAAATALLGRASAWAGEDLSKVRYAADPAHPQPGLEAAHVPEVALTKLAPADAPDGGAPASQRYRVAVRVAHATEASHHITLIAAYRNGERAGAYPKEKSDVPSPRAEFELEPGALLGLHLPQHWQRAAWCAGAWTAGCVVVPDGPPAQMDLLVSSPERAESLAAPLWPSRRSFASRR